jgi:hypothetical protein
MASFPVHTASVFLVKSDKSIVDFYSQGSQLLSGRIADVLTGVFNMCQSLHGRAGSVHLKRHDSFLPHPSHVTIHNHLIRRRIIYLLAVI